MSRLYSLSDDEDDFLAQAGPSRAPRIAQTRPAGEYADRERSLSPFGESAHIESYPTMDEEDSFDQRTRRGMTRLPSVLGDTYAGIGAELGLDADDLLGAEGAPPEPDITRLGRAWADERGAPEVLPWLGDIVDSVVNQMEQQVSILESLSTDASTSDEEHFRLNLVQLDVERARWLLRAYLRARLDKIERFVAYIILTPSAQRRLSDSELRYARKYHELYKSHLDASVLNFLPENMRTIYDVEGDGASGATIIAPNLDRPVFLRCREDCGQIRLPDGEEAYLGVGSIHLVRYRTVRRFLLQRKIELL